MLVEGGGFRGLSTQPVVGFSDLAWQKPIAPSRASPLMMFFFAQVVETYTEAVTQSLLWGPIMRAARTGSARATLSAFW